MRKKSEIAWPARAARARSRTAPPTGDEGPDFVAAVGRAFAVLRAFEPHERALGIRELARRTGLPKSTIGRLCYTLTRLGCLEPLPDGDKYALGIGVLTLAQRYLGGLDVRAVARPLMQELADATRFTVALAARDGGESGRDPMVFIEICHGHRLFRLSVEVGQRVPRLEWAESDYQKYGFCFTLDTEHRDIFAVAVPLTPAGGGQALALSCFGPAQEMTRARLLRDIGPEVVAVRDRIGARLRGER